MADEKTQGAGAATMSPGENTVQVTFLPEGKTVSSNMANCPTKTMANSSRCSTSR